MSQKHKALSKTHSTIAPRDVVARGAMSLDNSQLAGYRQLEQFGIGVNEIVSAMDDALVGPASTGSANPVQFLQAWLPGIVRQITRVRKIEALTGISTVGSWEDAEYVQRTSQLTGHPELYGDVSNIPLVNYKAGFEARGIVRFEAGIQVSRLEEARQAKTGFNEAVEKRAAAALALDIVRNQVGFSGFNSADTQIYGFLNDPNLPAYVSVPAGANGTSWATKTFLEITADIRKMHLDLVVGSGGNIQVGSGGDPITLALPLGYEQYLGVVSDMGVSVAQWLRDTYPTTRVESAPELTGANGGANAAYIYAERVGLDDSTDDGLTMIQVVPARFFALGTEQRAKGYIEDYTNALGGVMVKRPWAIRRYTGV
jgi:hypothetical protein